MSRSKWKSIAKSSLIVAAVFACYFIYISILIMLEILIEAKECKKIKHPSNDSLPITIPKSIQIPQMNDDEIKGCTCGGWGSWHSSGKSTPDCCIRQSTQILWAFADLFDKNGIDYSLKGGTLLGAIRCGQFLSYDYDIDIHVYANESNLKRIIDEWKEEQLKPNGILSKIGVTVGGLPWIGNGWGKFHRSNFKKGDVHVDFGFGLDRNQNVSVVPCVLGGKVLKCNANGRDELKKQYGEDWFIPHRWADWDKGTLCKECDKAQKEQCDGARSDVIEAYCEKYPNLLIGLNGCDGQDFTV